MQRAAAITGRCCLENPAAAGAAQIKRRCDGSINSATATVGHAIATKSAIPTATACSRTAKPALILSLPIQSDPATELDGSGVGNGQGPPQKRRCKGEPTIRG